MTKKASGPVGGSVALGVAASKAPPPTIISEALLAVAEGLVKIRQRAAARRVMLWLTSRDQSKFPRLLSLVSRAWADKESTGHITVLQHAHLGQLIQKPLKTKNYPRLLYLAARYEAIGKAMPLAVGDLIARQMVSDKGRLRIRDASAKALKLAPNSPFLAYLNAVTAAKCGDAASAGLDLSGRIKELAAQKQDGPAATQRSKRSFDVLRTAWRVVDQIARDDMQWLDGDKGKSYAGLATSEQSGGKAGAAIHFNEPLLQSRAADAYLAACRQQFNNAATPAAKLVAIKEMLREGARRRLSYHAEYAMADDCYGQMRDGLQAIYEGASSKGLSSKKAREIVRTLVLALDLSRTLGAGDTSEIIGRLAKLGRTPAFAGERWSIIAAIVDQHDPSAMQAARELREEILGLPETEAHLKSYLKWAMISRAFHEAETVFDQLKPSLRASEAALYFVNILQRQSRFTDAIKLIRAIHSQMLSRPAAIKPYIHWNLIRRYGEMDFLRKTASIFRKAPQPRDPVGVVVLAVRNVDQLRKYPLIVLMEMKRRGWAVIPLVEGLLPREMTGVSDLDVLNACVTLENSLIGTADALLPPIEGFAVDLANGFARWGDIDLSHSLLEDARVGRRAYNVDLTCPALQANLKRLVLSTTLFGRVIDYARIALAKQGRRGALMSLFNSRLPDSLFRVYCDKLGDADNFFCLHTTNGYENYFRNFQTSISTRCVIRNVTRYNHVRVASMPVPENLEQYYEDHRSDIAGVIAQISDMANVRRTTGGASTIDPDAEACRSRILEWRKKGGKVACLFGRVVCDGAVPFDGGPAHADLSDWLNHSIEAARGSDTLIVIKPHPHEVNEAIGTYLNEYFVDLIKGDIPENVIIMGHRWFDLQSLKEFVDLGLVYTSTAAMELALIELPTVVCGHFTPIDYPVGNIIPKDREHYARLVRFESDISPAPDLKARAAMWLQYMSTSGFVADYRYHSRPITNRVVYPPYWIDEDIRLYFAQGDSQVSLLASRAIGEAEEPGSSARRGRRKPRKRPKQATGAGARP